MGPFKIIAQINPINYCLELPPTMHLHPILHVSLLEPYRESQIPSRIPPSPPPIEIDHDMEYGVEKILDSRLRHRRFGIFHPLEGLWYWRTNLGTFIQLLECIR